MSLLNLAKAFNKKIEKRKQEKDGFSAVSFLVINDKSDKFVTNSFDVDGLKLWKSFDESYDLIDLNIHELEIDITQVIKNI